MQHPVVLLCGRFASDEIALIAGAAREAACDLAQAEHVDQALDWLEAHEARGLLCGFDVLEPLALKARCQERFSRLPILSVRNAPTDLDYVAAFTAGADDVTPTAPLRSLTAHLRALPADPPAPPANSRGHALVAEADQARRVAVARVLRNAGFAVNFAVCQVDAVALAGDPELTLVVVAEDILDSSREFAERVRGASSRTSVLVSCAPKRIKEQRQKLSGLVGTAATDSYAAPENVLFAANELTMGRTSGRASPRIVFGTVVAFRAAGRASDECGFTYNISDRGVYVRTTVPLQEEEVWLELRPPRTDRFVRLVGRVAWRRTFKHNENATVPPGFGVQITDGARQDLQLWTEGYNQLLEALGGPT